MPIEIQKIPAKIVEPEAPHPLRWFIIIALITLLGGGAIAIPVAERDVHTYGMVLALYSGSPTVCWDGLLCPSTTRL